MCVFCTLILPLWGTRGAIWHAQLTSNHDAVPSSPVVESALLAAGNWGLLTYVPTYLLTYLLTYGTVGL